MTILFFIKAIFFFCAAIATMNIANRIANYRVRFKDQTESYLKKNLPYDIRILSSLFENQGYKLYLVGGCIRDTFLRKKPKDYDLCTDLMPDKVEQLLKNQGYLCKLQGEHFGVVAVVINNVTYEIATFREDLNDTSDRNTTVRLGVTINDDVLRRDLTINALFYDIQQNEVIDLVNGIEHLRQGIVCAVGNPVERFQEDNLRKLRAIRFASRLGFKIDTQTFNAIKQDPNLNVTLERIYNELVMSFSSAKDIQRLTKLLSDSGLLKVIFKEIDVNTNIDFDTISSFSSWVAAICKNIPEISKTTLYKLKFPTVICSDVDFLLKYCVSDFDHVKTFNPLLFYKQIQGCSLFAEDILKFGHNAKHLKYLIKFRPNIEITKKFQNDGFEGKDLGDNLNRYYKMKYLSAITHG